jgi:(1->4)-alpha-D-glucan 1-alpha-D-glucosylmutase
LSSRIPNSTYRLQLNRDFNFKDATALVGYLYDLGISDCYLSPITVARAGSLHGYDIVNHNAINPDLGSSAAFQNFVHMLHERGMGIVQDIVPNHMSIGDPANQWWNDVLENGPSSPYAEFFDIDWSPPKNDLINKILLPVLGEQYGKVLENREIQVAYDSGSGTFQARYFNHSFPLAPRSLEWILRPALRALSHKVGDSHPEVLELESILNAVEHLPPRTESDRKKVHERRREIPVIRRRIFDLYQKSAEVRAALEESLADLNGIKGEPRSFDRLESLLADQAYRLSFWKVASDEINYRRFFDINELAAIRMEDRAVFAATHEMILKMIGQGFINGLRIDHVDGLLDPLQYLQRLQRSADECLDSRDGSSDAKPPFYIVVEKILGEHEKLQPWPLHGTTGYEFMNVVGRLFVDGENQQHFRDLYAGFIGERLNFRDIVYKSKKLIIETAMSGEMAVLARRLDRISEQHRWSRDFTLNGLGAALEEVIACFPVYRSYIRPYTGDVCDADRQHIQTAIRRAKRRNPTVSGSIFDFIASVLLLEHPAGLSDAERGERGEFVLRFQQFTAPVMAKGFEDTALYRYYPLASLNEVGGEPDAFGISVDTFHEWNRERLARQPNAISGSSTHDTKRGEDTRARIHVLSEIPDEWEQAIKRWYQMNSGARKNVEDQEVPDPNEEYLLYQTLIGVWPNVPIDDKQRDDLIKRIQSYMDKAVKEAKVHTSWMNVNEEHDRALSEFLASILKEGTEFVADFTKFHAHIARAGMLNALSQTLLKIAAPGVPDFYQGTELWALDLVDPDNRRPVDYARRRAMLTKIRTAARCDPLATTRHLLKDMSSGAIKMYLINRATEFRRENPELFMRGDYIPLNVTGPRANHVTAFARAHDGKRVIALCGRFFMQLPEAPALPVDPKAWAETSVEVEPGSSSSMTDVITGRSISIVGGRLALGDAFAQMPIAMLHD